MAPALLLLFKSLFKGVGHVFHVVDRPVAPDTLNNPKWGDHNYIQLPGLRMHYVSKGDSRNPLMIFLHGFPEFWFSWRFQLEHFSQRYWCVAPDNRGYGDTDKPVGITNYSVDYLCDDIKNLIKGLGKDKCILVGHDWGGAIGYQFCGKFPELVSQYIVCNLPHPTSFQKHLETTWDQKLKSWYILFFQCPWLPEIFLRSQDLSLFDGIFQEMKHCPDRENAIEAYKYAFRGKDTATATINYYRCALQYPKKQNVEVMKRIRVPVLSIFGTGDKYLSVAAAKDSRQFVDDFTDHYIDGCSHWVQMEESAKVNQIIDNYLKSRGSS